MSAVAAVAAAVVVVVVVAVAVAGAAMVAPDVVIAVVVAAVAAVAAESVDRDDLADADLNSGTIQVGRSVSLYSGKTTSKHETSMPDFAASSNATRSDSVQSSTWRTKAGKSSICGIASSSLSTGRQARKR